MFFSKIVNLKGVINNYLLKYLISIYDRMYFNVLNKKALYEMASFYRLEIR